MALKDGKRLDIDSEAIRELAALMEETGLTEIEVSEGDRRVRVAKTSPVAAYPAAMAGPVPAAAVPSAAGAPATPTASSEGAVTSPMVGTAYLRPDPTAQPYVKAGDTVNIGDTLLIIEAMKVMNPIKAAKAGRVSRIVVADAQPVEFGEVLLIVE